MCRACEKHAISITNGKPVIDASKCVQCGDCMAACPVQAVAGILPKRKIKQNHLIISDRHFPTTTELLILHKKGIRSIIFEDESLIQEWKQRIEQVNQMLMELGESPFSISIDSVEDEEYLFKKRIFLALEKRKQIINEADDPC